MKSSSILASPNRLRFNGLVLSRHSALNSVRDLQTPTRRFSVVVTSIIVGCGLIGTAVNMMLAADLGLAPYDVFSAGISEMAGLSLGQAGWLVAGALFALARLLGQRPSAWSVFYVLGSGVAIDLTGGLLNTPASFGGRIAMIATAIVVMAFGINFVLHAGVTGGAFELLMRAGAERGISPVKIRYALDISILLAGIAIGGPVGVATVVYAAAMGLVFARMRQVLEDHRAGRTARLDPIPAPVREEVGV